MLNTYDFKVSVASRIPEHSHVKTYRIDARDRHEARQKMWKVVLTTTPQFLQADIEWERHRGEYHEPRGTHDVEVRQALREHGDTTHYPQTPTPAFIYDITDKIRIRHTDNPTPDRYLTWDEFKDKWTTVPGYYI